MSAGVREVAKLAKVSIGTVSNVLNRPELVSPETVERVQAAIAQLNYQVGARRKGRQILAFGETTQGKAILEQVHASGLDITELDLSDESKRERLLKYLLSNKSAAVALLVVTQAGASAGELAQFLNGMPQP